MSLVPVNYFEHSWLLVISARHFMCFIGHDESIDGDHVGFSPKLGSLNLLATPDFDYCLDVTSE